MNNDLQQVNLQLKWKHQFQFAGYYAAIEKGYYSELGLQVNLLEAKEGEDPSNSVFNGKAEFGGGTKKFLGWLIGIAILIAVLWVTGFGGGLEKIFEFLFTSSWSGTVWTNFFFVAFIIIAVVVVIKVKK